MNIQSVANLDKMSLHVLVERVESGYFRASVPELIDCTAQAKTREEAIASVQDKIKARLPNIEILTLEVANNPWTEFIGMFEGDDEFADLAEELRAERELGTNKAI
jgi:predicted RNase H-like HicB family nuclease